MLFRRLRLRESRRKSQSFLHFNERGNGIFELSSNVQERGITVCGIDETPGGSKVGDACWPQVSFAAVTVAQSKTAEFSDVDFVESRTGIASVSPKHIRAHAKEKTSSLSSSTLTGGSASLARVRDQLAQETSWNEDEDKCLANASSERMEDDEDAKSGEHGAYQGMDREVWNAMDRSIIFELTKFLQEKGWTETTENFLLKKHFLQELSVRVVFKVLFRLQDAMLASSLFGWACTHMGHDALFYCAYLKVLAKAKQFDKMWNLLEKMKGLGVYVSFATFCILIRACRAAGVPAMAVELFKRAPEYGLELNTALYRALLSVLFMSNQPREARLLYSSMIQQGLRFNLATINTLIHGFGLTSSIEDVKKAFHGLQKVGFRPNLSCYEALISAYCNVDAVDKARSIFLQLRDSGPTPTATTLNIVIEALCRDSKVDVAIDLIHSVETWCPSDLFTYVSIFNALLANKNLSTAICVFWLMEEQVHLHRWTYINLMNGLCQMSQTKEIQVFLEDLFAKHGYSNAEVCVALLHNLTSLGEVQKAEALFNGMIDAKEKPILQAYTTMITWYCEMKMLERAQQVLTDLKDRSLKPNVFCYTPLIGALVNAGCIADAKKYFQEMLDHGYEMNAITCNHLLREVSKHNMIAEVPEILSIMLRNKLVMQGLTFFELAKCLCKAGKLKETNILCSSLYQLHHLNLNDKAAQQIFGVIKVLPPD